MKGQRYMWKSTETEQDFVSFLNQPIIKKSGKPFKSKEKIEFPVSIQKQNLGGKDRLCFVLMDGSFVECWRCERLPE
ncbi:MAG: hypothetical protein WC511_02215 [Candidatus Pacearchaeota archaeon]